MKTITATFHRSTEGIKLVRFINSNVRPIKAASIVNDIISSPEFDDCFYNTIETFAISESNDGSFDVVPSNATISAEESLLELLRMGTECYHNIQAIHWGARSSNFQIIHDTMQNIYREIQYQCDTIAEWLVELYDVVPNVLTFRYNAVDTSKGFDLPAAASRASSELANYLSQLQLVYPSLDHDIQSVLDVWIRYIRKELDYVLKESLR